MQSGDASRFASARPRRQHHGRRERPGAQPWHSRSASAAAFVLPVGHLEAGQQQPGDARNLEEACTNSRNFRLTKFLSKVLLCLLLLLLVHYIFINNFIVPKNSSKTFETHHWPSRGVGGEWSWRGCSEQHASQRQHISIMLCSRSFHSFPKSSFLRLVGNVFGLNVTSIALKILSVYVPRKRCVHVNNRIFKPVDDEPQMPIEHAFVSTLSYILFATASNLLRRCYVVKKRC